MLEENLQKVNYIWKSEGLDLAKPLSRGEVVDHYSKIGLSPCKEVFTVYSNLGGMTDWGTDSTWFSFWTINKILEENDSDSELIFFADFLINSHLYGFRIEDENIASIHICYGAKDIEKIADSFDEFFENYIANPEKYSLFGRENTQKIL